LLSAGLYALKLFHFTYFDGLLSEAEPRRPRQFECQPRRYIWRAARALLAQQQQRRSAASRCTRVQQAGTRCGPGLCACTCRIEIGRASATSAAVPRTTSASCAPRGEINTRHSVLKFHFLHVIE
jgi:hypothetical protein